MNMRTDLIDYYAARATCEKHLYILTADLGYGLFRDKWSDHPYVTLLNVGIAEQNMLGVAAGLALRGARVLCYSMASFITLRAAEQLCIDICADKRDVILMGAASGITNDVEGFTHHATGDIAILSTFPHIKILSPYDQHGLLDALADLGENHGPVYVRFGPEIQSENHVQRSKGGLGLPCILRSGNQVLLLAHGSMVQCASQVADLLEKYQVSCSVASCAWLEPFDYGYVMDLVQRHALSVVIEEHSEIGGLASRVAMCVARSPNCKMFLPFCIPSQ
jgi:transketolase